MIKINKVKDLYDFESPSLIILLLPYLSISWSKIFDIGFFSYTNLLFVLLFFILFDFIFNRFIWNNCKIQKWISILFVTIIFFFFYGDMFLPKSVSFINGLSPTFNFRYRWFFLAYFFFLSFIQLFFFSYNKKIYKVFNSYLIILFLIVIVSNFFEKKTTVVNINNINSTAIAIKPINNIQKPIILIITDEYASPNEIFNINKDLSVYNYSNSLRRKGWIIKNNFFSYEKSTINSISSLFNFNISKGNHYSNQSIINVSTHKLLKNSFYDSLSSKGIRLINYGIFDIGKSRPQTRLYAYPNNFIEQFLLGSSYFSLIMKSGVIKNSGNIKNDYPFEIHNKNVLNKLNKLNISNLNNNTFLYAHLFLPHNPFVFSPEFRLKKLNTSNYISFWKFTNTKMISLLNNLSKENKFRIIVTGDHGYRSEIRINPNNTFAAFWGFEKRDVELIKSVQDIGSLINGYYSIKTNEFN